MSIRGQITSDLGYRSHACPEPVEVAPAWERSCAAPAARDAERPQKRSHGDRGNDTQAATKPLSSAFCPDRTTSHSTRQPRNGSQVAGYLSSARGFSLFELVVVISIIAVLAGIFMGRVTYYQEQAEKTAMEGVAGAIQSALIIQYGRVLMHGKASDAAWLAKDNPMNWLQQKLDNYAGEIINPTPPDVEPGSWVFDLTSRDLIYVPRLTNNFKPGKDGKQWVRYHVVLQYEAPRLPSMPDAPPELTGLLFEPVEPYSWF